MNSDKRNKSMINAKNQYHNELHQVFTKLSSLLLIRSSRSSLSQCQIINIAAIFFHNIVT